MCSIEILLSLQQNLQRKTIKNKRPDGALFVKCLLLKKQRLERRSANWLAVRQSVHGRTSAPSEWLSR